MEVVFIIWELWFLSLKYISDIILKYSGPVWNFVIKIMVNVEFLIAFYKIKYFVTFSLGIISTIIKIENLGKSNIKWY